METKEVKIQVPEGYEIDKENSTFEYIKFKPKKLTYKEVAQSLFKSEEVYMLDSNSEITFIDDLHPDYADLPLNCYSEKQAKKLLALNKLINVAKYLNGDEKLNFKDSSYKKFFIKYDIKMNIIFVESSYNTTYGTPCFKTKELARQAIEILGEETIKLALSQV